MSLQQEVVKNVHANSNTRSLIMENNQFQDIFSEIKSVTDYSESHYSIQSRASKRSSRHLRNIPHPSISIKILVYNYRPPPRMLPEFDTIQQADVEAELKLRDFAFATTDQTAQHQKLFLEDEIEYENIKTATLIEQNQRKLEHENDLNEIENTRIKAEKETNMKKRKRISPRN